MEKMGRFLPPLQKKKTILTDDGRTNLNQTYDFV
jgi:hypothetical protein